ncbi:DEAD/DEAH box helicase (plasmid) [Polymorphobacter sp. PAMC 29334]|uniref:DEAD/DEAH box helicase n=1 Tax=Polymorphobacter sp. PAMC 29334 TaxID=2862331 RepID=UPI001C686E57|nr:DEAD/DEAH box helicase [Polymorphobacter sp. PAMC 29334]QYE37138.1 DEAD/DEAH box helicase [Polymorphobacter sp. PAMC 29334]
MIATHGIGHIDVMIPPITNALIADIIQTTSMVSAGHAYWLQGRVSALEINADFELISAEVRGGAATPYGVTILFPDNAGGAIEALVDCSCPVGFDCKHGAAVLFAVQARQSTAPGASPHLARVAPIASTRPVPLPQPLLQWLAEAQSEVQAAKRSVFDLVYVFAPRALHDGKSKKGKAPPAAGEPLAQRLVVSVWLWGQDAGGQFGGSQFVRSQPNWLQPSSYALRDGGLALRPVDQWLVRRMSNYGGDLDNHGTPKGAAGGDWIEKVIATGQARWRKADGPALRWGDDQPARWRWVTLAGGEQRLALDGLSPGQTLLATAPPIIVDEETGLIHRVQCDAEATLAQRLLLMPPIPPEAVPQLADHWPGIVGGAVPVPELDNLQNLGLIAPVPVLTFVQDKVDAISTRRRGYYSAATYKCDMAITRLSFDYAGTRVTSSTNGAEITSNGDAGFVRFTRDLRAEAQALDRLFSYGLMPLEAFDEIKSKHAQRWDFAPHPLAQATDFAAFMQTALPRLRAEDWRVEYGPKWQLTLAEVSSADMQFNVTPSGTDWFDISLGARIDGKIVDILPMLRQLLALGGPALLGQAGDTITVAIGPGKLAQLSTEQIRPVLAMLLEMALNEREASERMRLPSSDIAVLADLETASAGQIAWRGGDALRILARALTRIEMEATVTAASFKATLRPYQQQGLDWLQALHSAGFGGVLADDMGLGKTVQALAHITTLKAAGNLAAPALIICPTSVLPNWQAEIAQFTPELGVVLWHGNDRQNQTEALSAADIILSSYPLLLRDQKLFAAQNFGLILFDEAQVLKNPKTASFRAAKTLKAPQIVALSGTPVENQLTDIWSLTDLVTPNLLGSLDQFKRTIDKPITRDKDDQAKALLRRRLKPFMLRRTKDEVARELPEKTEISEWIDLEKNQLASYESLRLLMQKRVRDEIARVGLLRSQIVFLDALLKLRQLCCDPRLVPRSSGKGAGSAKLARLLEMLPELLREGRRILLFSQFTSMLDLIKPELDALQIAYVEIRGSTQDRDTPVRRFQADEVPLILVSLKAGGTGLNLTAADTVILYDPWWNPAVEAQAIDRAHRIGQSKPVFVHRLIARNTIEEKILGLQDKKRALAAMLWEGDDAAPAKLTAADIDFLLG